MQSKLVGGRKESGQVWEKARRRRHRCVMFSQTMLTLLVSISHPCLKAQIQFLFFWDAADEDSVWRASQWRPSTSFLHLRAKWARTPRCWVRCMNLLHIMQTSHFACPGMSAIHSAVFPKLSIIQEDARWKLIQQCSDPTAQHSVL